MGGVVKIWDTASGKERGSLNVNGSAHCLAFSPDGKWLAVGTGIWDQEKKNHLSGEVKIYDVASNSERAVLQGHTQHVASVVFSRDGKQLVSGSADKTIKVWDLSKLAE
jgi:WD40 repeat protein